VLIFVAVRVNVRQHQTASRIELKQAEKLAYFLVLCTVAFIFFHLANKYNGT
jgi:hypothetical protein